MSNDVVIRQAIRQSANTIGWWIFASALVMSLTMPLVGLGVFSAYTQYKINEAKQAMQESLQNRSR